MLFMCELPSFLGVISELVIRRGAFGDRCRNFRHLYLSDGVWVCCECMFSVEVMTIQAFVSEPVFEL